MRKKSRLVSSFKYAFRGIHQMLLTERNFQIEVLGLLINLFLIVYLKVNSADAALILITCFIVLSAEIFNTAIEKICDWVHPEISAKIALIKDISAGGVLILAIGSVAVAVLIYWKYF